jgi:putative redox protein
VAGTLLIQAGVASAASLGYTIYNHSKHQLANERDAPRRALRSRQIDKEPSMPSFTASAHSINGTPRHEVDVNGRHTLTTDQPHSYGGSDAGPSPHELVAATLASCASTMIVLYAQRKDWPLEHVQVDVNYDADTTPRRVETTVHLHGRLTDPQIRRLLRVADTCPVKHALEAGFLIRQRLADDHVPASNRALASRRRALAGEPALPA